MHLATYVRTSYRFISAIFHADSQETDVECKITFPTEVLGIITGGGNSNPQWIDELIETDDRLGIGKASFCASRCTPGRRWGCCDKDGNLNDDAKWGFSGPPSPQVGSSCTSSPRQAGCMPNNDDKCSSSGSVCTSNNCRNSAKQGDCPNQKCGSFDGDK